MKFKLLDCTIRDGGYINNWSYSLEFGQALYRAVSEAGVDYIEIGFFDPNYEGDNIWKNCKKETILKVKQDIAGAKVALLLNYGSISLEQIPPANELGADMLRVVTPFSKKEEATVFANQITALGYETTINYMAISNYGNDEIMELCELINKNKDIKYYYFADSFGSLIPARTKEIFQSISFFTDGALGFHPHNNLQLAFANVLEALQEGAAIVDGSILGMGRGGGNLYLEIALSYFEKLYPERFKLLPVLRFADIYMQPYKQQYTWGYSLPQLLSGVLSCHPNYPTNLLKSKMYPADEVYNILHQMQEPSKNRFNQDTLEDLVIEHVKAKKPAAQVTNSLRSLKNKAKKKAILLLGGPSILAAKSEISYLIESGEYAVFSVNKANNLFPIDGVFFGNRRRFIKYINEVPDELEVILSSSIDNQTTIDLDKKNKVSTVTFNDFYTKSMSQLPLKHFSNSGVEAIAGLFEIGFNNILVAGMDGYDVNQQNNHYYPEDDFNKTKKYQKEFNRITLNELGLIKSFFEKKEQTFKIITPSIFKDFVCQETLVQKQLS